MPASDNPGSPLRGGSTIDWDTVRGRQGPTATMTLAVVHAVLVAAAHPGIGLWPMAFLALAPLGWIALHARSLLLAAGVTWLTQFGLWLWMDRWMAGVTPVGFPLEAAYMAVWPTVFVLLLGRLSAYRRFRGVPQVIMLPAVWTALEVLRGELIFHGYPWYLIGHPLVEWPALAQIAEISGAYGVSFLAAFVAGGIVDAARPLRAPRPWISPRQSVRSAASCAVLITVVLVFGWWRIAALERDESSARRVSVIAIQTNLPQSNKVGWPIEEQRRDVASFIELTRRAFLEATTAEQGAPTLIAWPETMLPVRGLDAETVGALMRHDQRDELLFIQAILDLGAELGVPLLVGAPSYHGLRVEFDGERGRWAWDRHYNSAYVVAGEGPFDRYDKVHLTPFGEEIPYIAAWPWLEQRLSALAAGGMTLTLDAAADVTRLEVPDPAAGEPLRIGTPICFEDSMSGVCRRMAYDGGSKQIDLLVNLSNDGWFGFQDAARRQHAQIARFRAIENRVPILRCVNTGLSLGIAATGKVVAVVGTGRYGEARREGWVRADLALCDRTTVFGRIGNAFGWACVAVTLVAVVWTLHQPRMGWNPTT